VVTLSRVPRGAGSARCLAAEAGRLVLVDVHYVDQDRNGAAKVSGEHGGVLVEAEVIEERAGEAIISPYSDRPGRRAHLICDQIEPDRLPPNRTALNGLKTVLFLKIIYFLRVSYAL
jgi:hypothetical protein